MRTYDVLMALLVAGALIVVSATGGYLLGVEREAETSTRALEGLERCLNTAGDVMGAGGRALHIVEREDLSLTEALDLLPPSVVDR